jgi:hypothetical protein
VGSGAGVGFGEMVWEKAAMGQAPPYSFELLFFPSEFELLSFFFFLGGAFATGQAAQRGPQKKHGPASRRPRPSAESAPLS